MVAAGGLNVEGQVTANGGTIRSDGSAQMVAAGGGNVLSHNGGLMVAAGGGNILSHNGGLMVAAGGGNIVAAGAGNIVAAGGGNMVAAGGGNMVAAGGGNMVAAGGLNITAGVAQRAATQIGATTARRTQLQSAVVSSRDAVNERDAFMQKYTVLNTDPNVGLILVEAGGNAKAQNGGIIIADAGGILAGAGTFTGPGLIMNGGALVPGSSPGALTWDGNLTIESGGLLDLEIAGTTAGSLYDTVNVSGTFVMNGLPQIRFLNGFGANVQPTDTFDIVTAGAPISAAIAGNRVSISGTNATFAVLLVNGGKTLRLTDYQRVPVTFSSWAAQNGLSGANAEMTADPNGNGLSNLLEYALGRDPSAAGGGSAITAGTIDINGQKYLTLSYTKPAGEFAPSDITYDPQRATGLSAPADWSAGNLEQFAPAPGPGTLETITVRSTVPMSPGNPKEFLRL